MDNENIENRCNLLIDNASEMFWILDLDEEQFLYISPAVVQIRGFSPDEMRAHKLYEVMSRESESYIQNEFLKRRQHFQHGSLETYRDELQILRKDGALVWMEVSSRIVRNENTGHFEAYGVARDITDRLQIEQQVRQLSQAVQQSPASIIITDRNGDIIYVNPKFTEVTGYTYDEVLGENTRLLKTELTPAEVFPEMWEAISNGREWRGEFCNRKKSGEQYWELASISPILDRAGNITHYVAVKEDITERKQKDLALQAAYEQVNRQLTQIQMLQVALREQAIRDPLTGLYNRRYLYEALGQEFARARREDRAVSIIMMDIDHFKGLNDQFGHAAGDVMLQAMSDTLLGSTRKGDTVCRYGGEEILIAMPKTSLAQAQKRASKLRQEIAELRVPFEDKWLSITVSIGVAAFPEHGDTIDAVIQSADHALYYSKDAGRNRVTVYQS